MNGESLREELVNIARRSLALPAKLIGFKPCCLYLATWLLVTGRIGEWVWYAVLVAVLFGIVGLKAIGQLKASA
jgi:hypothetical protein